MKKNHLNRHVRIGLCIDILVFNAWKFLFKWDTEINWLNSSQMTLPIMSQIRFGALLMGLVGHEGLL